MTDPIIIRAGQPPVAANGLSFVVHEWSGSGPDYLPSIMLMTRPGTCWKGR